MIRMKLFAQTLPAVLGRDVVNLQSRSLLSRRTQRDAKAIAAYGTARNQQLAKLYALGSGANNDPIAQAVAWGVFRMLRLTALTSPVLTGTLAGSHRGEANTEEGVVFIDPSTVNPVYGGRPAEYGPLVHEGVSTPGWPRKRAKPWFAGAYHHWRATVEAEMLAIVGGEVAEGFGLQSALEYRRAQGVPEDTIRSLDAMGLFSLPDFYTRANTPPSYMLA